jgi:hypothetical protein
MKANKVANVVDHNSLLFSLFIVSSYYEKTRNIPGSFGKQPGQKYASQKNLRNFFS